MSLRVATLNVWAMPAPLGVDVAARMDAIGAALPALDVDVLGLQEVWLPSARDALIAHGHRAGLRYGSFAPGGVRGAAGGLMILSRHPLGDVRFEAFSLRGDIERVNQGEYIGGKGFLSAVVDAPGGGVQLVNTHLHARYGTTEDHEYRPHRTAQLVQLATRAFDSGLPVVVTGDFNFSEKSPEYRILSGLLGLADPVAALGVQKPTVYAHNPYRRDPHEGESLAERNRRKDFVFQRDGDAAVLRAREARRIFDDEFAIAGRRATYSNHAGVMVDFSLARRDAAGPGAASAGDVPALQHLAEAMLARGRSAAVERAREQTHWASAGVGVSVASLMMARWGPISRRGFLRAGLRGLAGLAVLPGAGLFLSARLALPREVAAFDEAQRMLASVSQGPRPGGMPPVSNAEALEGA